MYDGYLAFSGHEVINAERTATYIRALAPRLGLQDGCCDCDTTSAFFGEEYSTPLQDEPPWFAPFRPESAEFLGLIPLSLEGFDDSTRVANVTQMTEDGAVTSRPRHAGRELRVSALLTASTEKGLDYGMSWLRSALAGSGCAGIDCLGDTLCYLAHCPEVCQDDLVVDVVDEDYRNLSVTDARLFVDEWASDGTATAGRASSLTRITFTNLHEPVVSRVIDGLVPGAVYRVDVALLETLSSSAWWVDLSVAGLDLSGSAPWSFSSTGQPNAGATVEFVATDTRHRIVLTGSGTTASATTLPTSMAITGLTVTRLPDRALVMGSAIDSRRVDAAYAWAPSSAPANFTGPLMTVSRSGASFTWSHATGTHSATTGAFKASRTLTGLIPGHRYSVRVATMMEGSGTITPTTVGLTVATTEGSTTTSPSGVIGTGATQWVTHEFVAASQTTTLSVSNAAPLTMTGVASFALYLQYLRVDRVLLEDIQPVIDASAPLRTLRNVTTTSGPVVTEEFDAVGGWLRKVEWTMIAGSPQPQGEPVVVSTSMGVGTTLVPEVSCSSGHPILHNLITDPSFELTTGGATTVAGAGFALAYTTPTGDQPITGTKVLRAAPTGAVTAPANSGIAFTSQVLTQRMYYTLSAYVRSDVGLNVALGNGVNPIGEYTHLAAGGPMQRISATFTLTPTQSTTFVPSILVSTDTNLTTANYLVVDGLMLSPAPGLSLYVDGSVSGGSWDGAANASTSTWQYPVIPLVTDPSCPPPPAAPRPPVIVNPCVPAATAWVRHTITIPEHVVQVGQIGHPVVTMTTGALDARGVRVRVYANPFHRTPEQLDPCDYCGEFLVSYIPANAVVEVDASVRTITMTVSGSRQSGRHLLYGSDGGPMTWPTLTCGIPYVVTVDLDTAENPLIDLSLSLIPGY